MKLILYYWNIPSGRIMVGVDSASNRNKYQENLLG